MREKRREPASRPSPGLPAEGFGDRIARLRKARGWNQKQLAERLGARSARVSRYERGVYDPKPGILGPLAEALGTTVDYLLTGREPKTKRDQRLRNLLPILESLPAEQRDNVIYFLEALVRAHHLLAAYQIQRSGTATREALG